MAHKHHCVLCSSAKIPLVENNYLEFNVKHSFLDSFTPKLYLINCNINYMAWVINLIIRNNNTFQPGTSFKYFCWVLRVLDRHPPTLAPQLAERFVGISTRVAEETVIKIKGRKPLDRPFRSRKSASVLLVIGHRRFETFNYLLIGTLQYNYFIFN